MRYKNFKSVDGTEKYIALLTSHTYRIASEWVSIPEHAWQDCYAGGCISEDMLQHLIKEDAKEEVPSEDKLDFVAKEEEIRQLLKGWVDNNIMENFTKLGKPKLPLVRKSFPALQSHVLDRVWYALQDEMSDDTITVG